MGVERAAGLNGSPSKAGVVFQNAALARSPAERVVGFLRLAHIGAVEQMFGAVGQVRRAGCGD